MVAGCGIVERVWKILAVVAAMSAVAVPGRTQAARMQIPCPVLLVSGSADRESIRLSFLNKGKMPIQELSLACSPPTAGQAKSAICHTERGLFYPATKYWVEFGYSGAARHSILISVKAARLGDGSEWVALPHAACKPLTVLRKK
jgi:hypothetical protein